MNVLLLFSVFITFPSIAESADSGIRPDKSIISVTEGNSTTLSCTYDGSPDYLYWYLQKPGSRPEFLLMIIRATEDVTFANPLQTVLSIRLHKKESRVDLLISSAAVLDSALYYCAMRPTVTGNSDTLYKNCFIRLSVALIKRGSFFLLKTFSIQCSSRCDIHIPSQNEHL